MKQRTKFVIGGIVILAALSILSFRGLQEMTVFFYTPAEVLASPADFQDQTIRIGALVQSGVWSGTQTRSSFPSTSLKMGSSLFP
ncbi:MAG: cytochrome c maturation protein CcmE [SAR324 cluster bacterium]|nr:cytochrome c maturation protein CcmE [SAR324 cluster bacterium]